MAPDDTDPSQMQLFQEIGVLWADFDDIYHALIEHKVIFFRDQDINPETHIAFAKSFGEPEPPHPIYPSIEGYESIVLLKSGAGSKPDTNDWHKDLTFKANPPFTSILHAIEVPDVGGRYPMV